MWLLLLGAVAKYPCGHVQLRGVWIFVAGQWGPTFCLGRPHPWQGRHHGNYVLVAVA